VNPSKTRRKEASVVKTRSVNPFWDKPVRCLMTGQAATGVEGRDSDAGFCAELQEPVALMPREKPKRRKPRGESTDAEHWGGPIRSSDEGS
jgi:hypothetical protein